MKAVSSFVKFSEVDVTRVSRIGFIPYFYLSGQLWLGFAISSFSGKLGTIGGEVEIGDFNSLDALYRERDEETPGIPLDSPEIIGRNDCILFYPHVVVFQEVDPSLMWYEVEKDATEVFGVTWLSQEELKVRRTRRGMENFGLGRLIQEIYILLSQVRPSLGPNIPPKNHDKPQVRDIPLTLGDYSDLKKDLPKVPWYHIFLVYAGSYTYITSGGRKYRVHNYQRENAIGAILSQYKQRQIFTIKSLSLFLEKAKMGREADLMMQEIHPDSTPEAILDILYKYKEMEYHKAEKSKSMVKLHKYDEINAFNRKIVESELAAQ